MGQTQTQIMGILNVSPNSDNAQGKAIGVEAACVRALEIERNGAHIIDIGGAASFPGAPPVSEEVERERVIPAIQAIKQITSLPISIDTTKPAIAAEAVEAGASLINDITAFQDPAMREVAASTEARLCLMHMRGTPGTMNSRDPYEGGIISFLLRWFEEQITRLIQAGFKESRILLDPGYGMGKTVADNLQIIQNLPKLRALGFPLLLGVSRKRSIKKILGRELAACLAGTLTLNTIAVMNGVDMIRVHDIAEHVDVIKMVNAVKAGDACSN